jgi:uncharacterized protein YuzE
MTDDKIIVSYDKKGDVLYISSREEAATKGKTDSYGIVWRYGADGNLIGATVMDFADYWAGHHVTLERELSHMFGVPVAQIRVVLSNA